ncbi:MAG TPA: hypothetical protein V6D03_09280, partial [Candidatus Caenarcaniphilales bacterium]
MKIEFVQTSSLARAILCAIATTPLLLGVLPGKAHNSPSQGPVSQTSNPTTTPPGGTIQADPTTPGTTTPGTTTPGTT